MQPKVLMLLFSEEENSFEAIHLPIWFEYFDDIELPELLQSPTWSYMVLRSTLSYKFWIDLNKEWQNNTT